MFGWGRWSDIVEHCQLSKKLAEREVEEVARAVLALAASSYNGDDKVKQFIWELITPPEFTHELHHLQGVNGTGNRKETKKSKRGRESESPPPIEEGREWVIALDGLLTDDNFRRHVMTHANKLLGRVRVLNYLRTEILADWLDHIKDDVPSADYELDVPVIEGEPPAPWWEEEADKSLLVGIFKHGYDRYSLIRNDPSLVFLDKVGPADDKALMADLMEGESKPNCGGADGDKDYKPKHKNLFEEQEQLLEGAGQRSESAEPMPVGAATPPIAAAAGENAGAVEKVEAGAKEAEAVTAPVVANEAEKTPQAAKSPEGVKEEAVAVSTEQSGAADCCKPPTQETPAQDGQQQQQQVAPLIQYAPWPSPADLNKRFRMIIAAYQRIFRRAAARAQRMNKNRVQRQITERWTKREESDFYRAVSTFGTEMAPSGQFKWDRFRLVAKLDKKTDVSLTNYYIAFRAMCERTCRRTTIPDEDLPAVYVEQISEDRASRTLFRIQLLDRIRRECLVHPNLEKRLKHCQTSPDLPIWWIPGKHDKELLMGMHRHGLSRCEIHILNDPDLSFGAAMKAAQKTAPRIRIKSIEPKEPENAEAETKPAKEESKTGEDEAGKDGESPEEKIETKAEENGTNEAMETEAEVTENGVEKEEKEEEKMETEVTKEEKSPEGEVTKEETEKTECEREEEDPSIPVIEVASEAEKQMLEAEFIQQQALNRWPKDKILMQRAEHVCFCIIQGEWPTPKLLNSMMNLTGVGGGSGAASVGGATGIDSPRLSDSPQSDYPHRPTNKGSKFRGRPQSRTQFTPPNSTLDAIQNSQQERFRE